MQEILRKVAGAYKDFSSGQKKVGDLFVQEPIFLAFSSALEVGKRVDVSESTVIRWTQKLGYKGYAEFQQVIQRKLAEERLVQAEEEMLQSEIDQSFLENLLDADILSIVKLKQTIDEEKLLQVVDIISSAEHIYVTSNFFDFGLAHWFSGWLNTTLGQTEMMMSSEGQYYSQLAKVSEGDILIAFAFPRYTRVLIDTLKTVKERGAQIIVLTDSNDSPAGEYADTLLPVALNSNLNIDSYTAVHALLSSIMRFVYVKEHAKVKRNLTRIEEIYKEKDVFL